MLPSLLVGMCVYDFDVDFRLIRIHTDRPFKPLPPGSYLQRILFTCTWEIEDGTTNWDEALNYPLNVGGRPFNSWPAFAVGTFEIMLLITIAAGFFGMLAFSRLPKLYHPIFEANSFARASRDRFVICVEATDLRFDASALRNIFQQLGAERIEEVRA